MEHPLAAWLTRRPQIATALAELGIDGSATDAGFILETLAGSDTRPDIRDAVRSGLNMNDGSSATIVEVVQTETVVDKTIESLYRGYAVPCNKNYLHGALYTWSNHGSEWPRHQL